MLKAGILDRQQSINLWLSLDNLCPGHCGSADAGERISKEAPGGEELIGSVLGTEESARCRDMLEDADLLLGDVDAGSVAVAGEELL